MRMDAFIYLVKCCQLGNDILAILFALSIALTQRGYKLRNK